jgi:hypothetical protein
MNIVLENFWLKSKKIISDVVKQNRKNKNSDFYIELSSKAFKHLD